jgi:hypothetical protein
MKKSPAILLLMALISRNLSAQELPRADFENTLYMLPLFERIRVPGMLSYEQKEEQLLKMKHELGEGNLYQLKFMKY